MALELLVQLARLLREKVRPAGHGRRGGRRQPGLQFRGAGQKNGPDLRRPFRQRQEGGLGDTGLVFGIVEPSGRQQLPGQPGMLAMAFQGRLQQGHAALGMSLQRVPKQQDGLVRMGLQASEQDLHGRFQIDGPFRSLQSRGLPAQSDAENEKNCELHEVDVERVVGIEPT